MITLDAFLVFLAAASLPVIYLFIASYWVEPEYRKVCAAGTTTNAVSADSELLKKAA
jgi:hypothetical protein